MKTTPIIVCLVISATIIGCDTSKDRMELKQGMTESQVESKYGTPDSAIKDSYANNGRNKTVEYLLKDRKITIDYHSYKKEPLTIVYWKTDLLTDSEAEAAHKAYLLRVRTAKAFPDTLPDAAHLTYAAYVRAVNAGETAPSETIPPLYWAERIKQLKPIRVYTHRVNIVVVQSVLNNVESGKYIYIPVSSYLPMNGDDGFAFNPNPKKGKTYRVHEVLDFTRPTGN